MTTKFKFQSKTLAATIAILTRELNQDLSYKEDTDVFNSDDFITIKTKETYKSISDVFFFMKEIFGVNEEQWIYDDKNGTFSGYSILCKDKNTNTYSLIERDKFDNATKFPKNPENYEFEQKIIYFKVHDEKEEVDPYTDIIEYYFQEEENK